MLLQLNGDGSGVFDNEVLRYTVKGNVLTVTIGVESTAYSFSLNGNQLTLAGGDLDGKVIFSRGWGLAPAPQQLIVHRHSVILRGN